MGKALTSFPVATSVESEEEREEREEREEIEEEIHKSEDVSIKVTQMPGFLCHIEATAAFRMPAHALFKQVVTHPDNASIFRGMDRCSYRRILEDDGCGRRKVQVEHEASWRFLLWSGKFTTKLIVEEDDNELIMDFQLDPNGGGGPGGIMKKFHGRWHIRPHPLDPEHASLTTLEQELALGVFMPPPFDRILKRISCSHIKKLFEDVQKEAGKVNKGKPSLCPWGQVKDKEIGVERGAGTAAGAAGGAEGGASAPSGGAAAGAGVAAVGAVENAIPAAAAGGAAAGGDREVRVS